MRAYLALAVMAQMSRALTLSVPIPLNDHHQQDAIVRAMSTSDAAAGASSPSRGPSSDGDRVGYHGPYYPRPGGPYLMVGCDVLDEPEPRSAVPIPKGQRWWHNYNSDLPKHLIDVSVHSIVLVRTDLEGWIVPDSIDVLPTPSEFKTDAEHAGPFRAEYARWLEENQTVGSAAWLVEHPAGLPYIPPDIPPATRNWHPLLPEHLREFSSKLPVVFSRDGNDWLQPGSIDFPSLRGKPLSDNVSKMRDELDQWLNDHMTEGYGVASAHRQLEMRCHGGTVQQDSGLEMLRPMPLYMYTSGQTLNITRIGHSQSVSPGVDDGIAILDNLQDALIRLNTTQWLLIAFVLYLASVFIVRFTSILVRSIIRRCRYSGSSFARHPDEAKPYRADPFAPLLNKEAV